MASAGDGTPRRTPGSSVALTSQSQANEDTDVTDRTDKAEEKAKKTPVHVGTDIGETTPTQILDVSVPLQLPNDFAAVDPSAKECDLRTSATATSEASVNESSNDKSANLTQNDQISQSSFSSAEIEAVQPRAFATDISLRPASGQGSKEVREPETKGTDAADLTTEKAQADKQPDAASIQKSPVDSTSQSPDSGIGSQINLALESEFANPQTLSNSTTPRQSAIKPAHAKNMSGAVSAASDLAGAKNQPRANAVNPVTAPASSSQSTQASAHSQIDISQSSASAAKTSDGSVLTTDLASVPQSNHDAPSSPSSSTDAGAGLHREEDFRAVPQNHLDGSATAGLSGINTARVMQTMSETEMRVGMRSVEFGDISIRTSVSQQQLVAQITVDHRDLGNAISSHISAAQLKLGNDYGIHASIEVNQAGTSFSGDRQNPEQQTQRQSFRSLQSPGVSVESKGPTPILVTALSDAYRLDIRA